MTDTKHQIACSACARKMTKVFVKSAGFWVDICLENCGGIYFDQREFKVFEDNEADAREILDVVEGKYFNSADQQKTRVCPKCVDKMVRNAGKCGTEVDVCLKCGGKFLDADEFEKLINSDEEKDYLEIVMDSEDGSGQVEVRFEVD
jgi:Zn-finger nucleic acid-binding protein